MRQFLLQMAGGPGSGKTTLAVTIARRTGAIPLDKDVIKSAALTAGANEELAGPLAYQVFFAMANSLAQAGHSVVLDSPAFFADIADRGQDIAQTAGAGYFLVRCYCPEDQLVARLQARPAMPSQWEGITSTDEYRERMRVALTRPGTIATPALPHLCVNTSEALDACVAQVLAYIGYDAG
jgi:predicted kinase